MLIFEFDIHFRENDKRTFLGTDDCGTYCTDTEIAEEEEDFEESISDFEMIMYAHTVFTSTSYYRASTL